MTESKAQVIDRRKAPVRRKTVVGEASTSRVRQSKKTSEGELKASKAASVSAVGERYWSAVGRRKESTAKIKLFLGTGDRLVNGKLFTKYFPSDKLQRTVLAPLVSVGMGDSASFVVTTRGGGVAGQATATQLAVARALVAFDPHFKKTFRSHGFMTRDPRVKERKKYGLKRARRAPQWSKR